MNRSIYLPLSGCMCIFRQEGHKSNSWKESLSTVTWFFFDRLARSLVEEICFMPKMNEQKRNYTHFFVIYVYSKFMSIIPYVRLVHINKV